MIRVCDIIHVTQTIGTPSLSTAKPAETARDLATAIIADYRATMTQLKCASSERLLREGVSMAQLHIMFTVQRHGEMTMSQLADVLNVSDSSATGLVDRMAERGFVLRDRVAADRRVVIVRITEAGEALLREMDALSDEIFRTVLSRLGPSQLRSVGQAVAELRAAVDATVAMDVDSHGVSTSIPRSPISMRASGLAKQHMEGTEH
jgi:DNA-binding MarR family transcriptional regulator